MAAQRVNLVSLLLGLISSLIACVQVNFAMLTVHLNYVRERANISKLLSLSDGRKAVETTGKATPSPILLRFRHFKVDF